MTSTLLTYIRQHSIQCYALPNGNIAVLGEYGDGSTEWHEIEASVQAVRDWLGY